MKKIWTVLITLALCIGMMLGGVETVMAEAEGSDMAPVWVGGVQMQIGDPYINKPNSSPKTVVKTETFTNYNAYVERDEDNKDAYTLYINNLDVEGKSSGLNITGNGVAPRHQYAGIFSTADNLTIVVNGTNTVKGADVQGEIYDSKSKLSDGVFVGGNLIIERADSATEATLSATGGTSSELSTGIYASNDMTIDKVNVEATGGDCSSGSPGASIGIRCENELTVGSNPNAADDKTKLKATGGKGSSSNGGYSYAIQFTQLCLNSGELDLNTNNADKQWVGFSDSSVGNVYIPEGMAARYSDEVGNNIFQIGQENAYDYNAPEVQHWATKTSVKLRLVEGYVCKVVVNKGKITGSTQYKVVNSGDKITTEMYIGDFDSNSNSTSGYFIAGRQVNIATIEQIEGEDKPKDGSTFIDWKIEKDDPSVRIDNLSHSENGEKIEITLPPTDLTLTALYGYKLEVKDGSIVDVDTEATKATEGIYPVGTEITIEASQPAEGMRCTGWEGIDGLNATVVDNSTKKIKFKMPNKDVSIKAKYGPIPVLTINGEDKVCNGNDYTFTFTLPEGVINPTAGYNVGETTGGQLTVTGPENGIYTVTVKEDCYKTGYENGEATIKVSIEAETSDGYEVTTSKDVTIVEHSGGTATCKDKAICDYCEKEYGEKDTTKHVGGTEIKGTKAATCTEAGYTGDTYCKGCEAKLSDGKSIPATGHDMTKTEAKAATCTEEGNIEYWYCSNCDKYFADADGKTETTVADQIIPATGHDMTKTEAKAATCTEEGNIEYWYCSNCDKYFADADGTTEIALADTVIDKLPADSEPATTDSDQSSETGDNFNMSLLIALMIASCGGFTATTLYRRRHVK